MKECSKAIPRRLADTRFVRRYFRGRGIDIGGAPDPLALYAELFPLAESIETWDLEQGDAQLMQGVADASYDFVHSSHCLEHLEDPREGLRQWFRILRPGGHLIVTVPDEDLYEQGVFPSRFNAGHRWTFCIWKPASWSPRSLSVTELVAGLGAAADVHRIELLDGAHRYGLPRYDQTLTPVGESGIEFVVRKRPPAEIDAGGRLPGSQQPERRLRLHLNQYRDDHAALKAGNAGRPPFRNDREIE